MHHWRLHHSINTFSIWEAIPVIITASQRLTISGKKPIDHSPPKGKRRGKDALRSLYTAWKDHNCKHPYSMVRWDLVYKVARCTKCGASVKRSKKLPDQYVIKKNQKNKPVLDARYYERKEITLGTALMMFLFQRGIVDTTWNDAVDLARAVKPGTRFSASSFSWYRNHFIQKYMKRKETPLMSKKKKKNKGKKKVRSVPKKKRITGKKAAKKGPKKPTIQSIVLDYFDDVGVDDATFEKTRKRVLRVHPSSAFKETHMGWYKSKYREINE